MSTACALVASGYRPRAPERSAWQAALRSELKTLVAMKPVRAHVERALRKNATCGELAKGFARVRCVECRAEQLVACSCKDRGLCPSCTGRRAAETAAHLIDEVLPEVPMRQYVLALPFEWHGRVAADPALETALLGGVQRELAAFQRAQVGRGAEAQPGSVTFLQRFGSTLNLHVHFHVLALDGVYVPGEDGAPRFVRAPVPTRTQLEALLARVARRLRGIAETSASRDPEEDQTLPVLRLVAAEPRAPEEPRLHARVDGFDLHAGTVFEAHERVGIERFCRYALRGPLAASRLSPGPRGLLVYRLKAPRRDGTTELLLTPLALLERMARLAPAPRMHLTRYHGVLAPAAKWRPKVVPAKPLAPGLAVRKPMRRIAWADLLRRVFAFELLICACGGRRRVLATIDEGPVARKILTHLGLPAEPSRLAPARITQGSLWDTGPPPEPAPEHRVDDLDQRLPDDLLPD